MDYGVLSSSEVEQIKLENAQLRDQVIALQEELDQTRKTGDDIVQQMKLQGALEMAGTTCHEMNQPLYIIQGNCELLDIELPDDHPSRVLLETIMSQVERMGDITRKLGQIVRYTTSDYPGGAQILDLDKAIE
jgi:signal transduction histidine kinase